MNLTVVARLVMLAAHIVSVYLHGRSGQPTMSYSLLCLLRQNSFVLVCGWLVEKSIIYGAFGSTWGYNFYMSTQNGSKLEIWSKRIMIHALELKLWHLEVFPCLSREGMHLQWFTWGAWPRVQINVMTITRFAQNNTIGVCFHCHPCSYKIRVAIGILCHVLFSGCYFSCLKRKRL